MTIATKHRHNTREGPQLPTDHTDRSSALPPQALSLCGLKCFLSLISSSLLLLLFLSVLNLFYSLGTADRVLIPVLRPLCDAGVDKSDCWCGVSSKLDTVCCLLSTFATTVSTYVPGTHQKHMQWTGRNILKNWMKTKSSGKGRLVKNIILPPWCLLHLFIYLFLNAHSNSSSWLD